MLDSFVLWEIAISYEHGSSNCRFLHKQHLKATGKVLDVLARRLSYNQTFASLLAMELAKCEPRSKYTLLHSNGSPTHFVASILICSYFYRRIGLGHNSM